MSADAEVPTGWATESMVLADTDPDWTLRGERERDQLETLLAPWRIEHVGSTSIPGLAAKPIIDLQALVADFADPHSLAAALAPHDWHYVDPDLDQRPWRCFLVEVIDGRRSAHVHVMTPDSARCHQQIAFRDTLRGLHYDRGLRRTQTHSRCRTRRRSRGLLRRQGGLRPISPRYADVATTPPSYWSTHNACLPTMRVRPSNETPARRPGEECKDRPNVGRFRRSL